METDSSESPVLQRARKRFDLAVSSEHDQRERMRADFRFHAGTPDNGWQWPDVARQARENSPGGPRPCLTTNRVAGAVAQVVNDLRQNRPSIKYLPADDRADIKTAEMLTGLARHIQAMSDADTAYDTAGSHACIAGLGYIVVTTDYVDDESLDQELKIERVQNPLSIYFDPDARDPAGSDAQWAFRAEWISRDEFKSRWPEAEPADWGAVAAGDQALTWYTEKRVRIVQYYEVTSEAFDLSAPGGADAVPSRGRRVERRQVTIHTLCGHAVLESTPWVGRTIPIARVVGNEFVIDGEVIFTGLVANAKSDQQMINYYYSAEAELIGLSPKAPFVGAAGQFDGFEHQWEGANVESRPYLEYNPVVDTLAGQSPFPPPQRVAPPMVSPGLQTGKMGAIDGVKATTGIFDASLGQRSNETSGIAIQRRNAQANTATFNYPDNLGKAIRYIGRILVEAIPKVYDTLRVARILGEDESHDWAQVDPSLPQAYAEVPGPDGAIQTIYNPGVGRYDVLAVSGPSYVTKRQEAADGMSQLVQANPAVFQVIGDLLVKSLDWPGADLMAKRLKAMLPPQAAAADHEGKPGAAPALPPEVEQLQQQHEQLVQALHAAQDKLDEAEKSRDLDAAKLQIDHYRAETERMKALQPGINPQEIAMLAAQLVLQAMHSPAQPEPGAPPIPVGSEAEGPEDEAAEGPSMGLPSMGGPSPQPTAEVSNGPG